MEKEGGNRVKRREGWCRVERREAAGWFGGRKQCGKEGGSRLEKRERVERRKGARWKERVEIWLERKNGGGWLGERSRVERKDRGGWSASRKQAGKEGGSRVERREGTD